MEAVAHVLGTQGQTEALLTTAGLAAYGAHFAAEGYSFVSDLLEADEEDLEELIQGSGMKKPEGKRLRKALGALNAGGGGAHQIEPQPEPEPEVLEGPGSGGAAMSERVLSVEEIPLALTPITGWQDKPLIALVQSVERVPVKDVALHAQVAVEFGEQYKMLHPTDPRSVHQLGAVHLYTQG